MSRQLPPTITADQTPEWLPAGWVAHSTVLTRGRQKRTYTNLRNGKKFSTKDQVLEYIKMEKIREKREDGIERRKASLKAFQDTKTTLERPSWLPDDWQREVRIGAYGGNHYKMYVNPSTGFKTNLREKVLSYQNTMESQASSSGEEEEETGCNQISYLFDESEEDFSENEYFKHKLPQENVELRTQPERMQKLESRAKTQCVFEDEDMSSDGEGRLAEAKTYKQENASGEAQVVSNLVETLVKENVHGFVVECDDNTREIPGLRGSLCIELNLEPEPEIDSLVEKDLNKSGNEGIGTRNDEVRDQDTDFMHISGSSKVIDLTQEPGNTNGEQKHPEESAEEARRSVFFPCTEAPSHSVLVFDNSKAGSSADDLMNTIELDLNTCADTLQEKNICGSKKRKKAAKPCPSKNVEKKDTEAPTDKLHKGKKTPSKPQGKKGSSNVVSEKKRVVWPEPNPHFPFEPLETWIEDDSVIRRYLEEYATAAGNADGDIPLPDFGLPSFANMKISVNEEPDESEKKKSLDTPCVEVASSSLPSCSSIGTASYASDSCRKIK